MSLEFHLLIESECRNDPFENSVGKGENAGKQCFLLYQKQKSVLHLICCLQMF